MIGNTEIRIRLLVLLTPLWFTGVIVLVSSMHPEYSHISQYVSELGETGAPHADLMNYAGYVTTGVLMIFFALSIRSALGSELLSIIAVILFVLTGAGLVTAGFFHCDPGCAEEGNSSSAICHDVASYMVLSASSLSPFALATHRSNSSRLFLWSSATGLILAAIFILFLSPQTAGYEGLLQRLFLATYILWFVSFGLNISKQEN